MDALDNLQRQLGAPVVAFAQEYWWAFVLGAVALVLWSLGVSRRVYIRNGWTLFPDRNGRSRGFEEDLGFRGPGESDDD